MIPDNLIVLEMANNHMGNLDHGIQIISAFENVCKNYPEFNFAFKLQYRNLETFIHPEMQNRSDIKYIKRFSETKLSRKEFDCLIEHIRNSGFLTMATPFDSDSVPILTEQKLDILKIASCSFTDWPLLETAVSSGLPIIASTAGADLDEIDRVISFFLHRNIEFAILHCVGEYPTPDNKMHLSQIDFLKSRYPGIKIGFSTHEDPSNDDIVKIAIAKGANIFEKHVGLETSSAPLNAYSCNPKQFETWLNAARYARSVCGEGHGRSPVNHEERSSLKALRRGIFAKRDIEIGEAIKLEDIYFAFPPNDNQYTANDWSKYNRFVASAKIEKNSAITNSNSEFINTRQNVLKIAERVKQFLERSGVIFPAGAELEISHHYGIEKFDQYGLTLITIVNREYCKKLLILLPGQTHPEQFHRKKEETFHVLHGTVNLTLDGKARQYNPGDVVTIEPGVRHAFTSDHGCVIEEISSTHFVDDSFYSDESISKNLSRKTMIRYWI